MTAPTASAQSPNVNSTDPKIANEIGVVFAHEFYTFLNKDPTRLHCFYNKDSTMSHGYQGEQIKVFNGQQAINEKILDLGFEDCKVLVSNLDCQGSIHGGIVVQVLGEMSNRGGPAQKFVQTFFLAVQPMGYYVHNDIFRFLKDDHQEEQEDEDNQEQEQQEEDEDLTEMYAEKAEDDDDEVEVSVLEAGSEVIAIVPEIEFKVAVAQAPAATAATAAPDVIITEQKESGAATPARKPEPVGPIKTETALPVKVAPAAQPEPTTAPAPAPAPVQAPTPAGPPKQKTWANLAATSKAATPVVVPAPAKPQTPIPTAASHNQGQGQSQAGYGQQGHGQGQGHGRKFVEYHSIFIKNVNDRITEEQLREAFSKFGRIKHLDMTQKKNCAFMDFVTPESVVAALKQRNVQVGNEVVLAEERRRGNHGFNNNNGPGGSANGRQGYYGNNNNVNGHQQQPQGAYRGGRGGSNSNGVRGGSPQDRKPTSNKNQGVRS
ncbi:hypothetical protein BGZ47_007451 [Haplosporangium gracile]|nr:hypothetical protein BGZ47_007451 [Haplosporangium gracile]